MIRKIVAAGLGSLLAAGVPAVAQEVPAQDMPELDGGPPPLKIPAAKPKPKVSAPKPAPAKPTEARQAQVKQTQAKPEAAKAKVVAADRKPPADDKLKVTQSQLAKQAEAQDAEKARLERQAAELKAQQDSLEARIAMLSAREKGVEDREADLAAQKAELDRQRKDLAAQAAKLAAADGDERPEAPVYNRTSLDRSRAVEACERAGDDEARARNFYSAEYNAKPYFSFGQTWQVRGQMRLESRIGYKIVDTICEVDEDGEAQRFVFLR